MQVDVASALRQQLQAQSSSAESILKAKFIEWKSQPGQDHYWFSRDVLGDDKHLRHVHLIPNNVQPDRVAWDGFWSKNQSSRRRSDRYLLYADRGMGRYLLISLIEDPGAHALWEKSHTATRKAFEVVAENFVTFGQVP